MGSQSLTSTVFASFRALGAEIDRLDQAAADRFGLNRTDMRALDIVSSSGPLSPTALARRLGFTTGGVTSVLDRLERTGYVRRLIDPDDRRRQLIEATETAAARNREVFSGLIRATKCLLETFTEDQLLAIRAFLDRTGELTSDYADELTVHDGSRPVTARPSTSQRTRTGTGQPTLRRGRQAPA